MSHVSHKAPQIAVVGGGISGLAAVHRLLELRPDASVTLFEAADRVGGVLQTVSRNGYLIERSADNFLTKLPWASDLCQRVGIGDALLPTDERRRRALVVHRGQIKRVPDGFVVMSPKALLPILRSDILSWRGKLRLCCEPLVPRRSSREDESVASFARRRLGQEAFERLVQPLLAGIYTADAERLSVAACVPQFLEQEKEHGGLWRAARKEAKNKPDHSAADESGARYSMFLAPRHGMSQLIDAVADRLPNDCLRTRTRVASLLRTEDQQWALTNDGGQSLGSFDGVVLTTPAYHTATIVEGVDPKLASELASIEYSSVSIVCLGYNANQIDRSLAGFGFVVPAVERRDIIAASFASLKFPGRAPEGKLLVRVFVGGALQPELAELDDQDLIELVAQELAELIGAQGKPELIEIARWPRSMPQYHVGHLARLERIEQTVTNYPGMALAGAAYRGVGIPQCIHSGEVAAESVLSDWGS